MSDEMATNEQLIELAHQSVGNATARMVAMVKQQGYSIVATAPRTFRLARTRRRLVVGKQHDSVVVTIFEDRNGTKLRIVGELDQLVVDHLLQGSAPAGGQRSAPAGGDASRFTPPPTSVPGHVAPDQAQPPAQFAPPQQPVGQQQPQVARPAPMVGPPGGDQPAWWQPQPAQPVDHTVVLGHQRRASQPSRLELPGGRVLQLNSPRLLGRNPDVALGPHGSVAEAVGDSSLSRTHALFEQAGGQLYVTDLHSTNGTTVIVDGNATVCSPGARTEVPFGATIRIGAVPIEVRGGL